MRIAPSFVFVFVMLMMGLQAKAQTAPPRQILTVVATTDLHGALEAEALVTASGEKVEVGGAALLSSYIKILKSKTQGPVILVDAGDLFQGSMVSNMAGGAPVIKFYNYMHVAAVALGNHEFDYGPGGGKSVPTDPSDDPRGVLKQRIHEARFPFLAVNVFDKDGATPSWLRRSMVYRRNGLKVGIIGAATPETPSTTTKANLIGLRFEEPLAYVEKEARELREKKKVDVVILAFHGGGACTNNSKKTQDDLSSCKDGELFHLLKALPAGLIDVAVGGHTHQGIAKRVNGTAVIQAYSHARQLGWAQVPIGTPGGKPEVGGFVSVCGNVVQGAGQYPTCLPTSVKASHGPVSQASFLGVTVRPDEQVERLLAPDFARVKAVKETPLGVDAMTPMTRAYYGESELGNLTADVLRMAVKGADLGVTNGGGLRANIPAGPLVYGEIFDLLPFDNRAATLTVSGELVRRMVVIGHSGENGSLSWSNLKFWADGCTVKKIEVAGAPLDLNANYHIVTNDYLAQGGSGFDKVGYKLEQVKVLYNGNYVLRDLVAGAIKKWAKPLRAEDFYNPAQPRQVVTSKCEPK